jgi:hypothetical protein
MRVRCVQVYTGCFVHDGLARHELVSTRSYGYLEKLNARIAGLNADRIIIVSHVPYVRIEMFCSVCVNILTPEFPDRTYMKF